MVALECAICGERAAHVVVGSSAFRTPGGYMLLFECDQYTHCDSCDETYYTGPQWIVVDARMRSSGEYVVISVASKGMKPPFRVVTSASTISATIFPAVIDSHKPFEYLSPIGTSVGAHTVVAGR